MLNQVTRRKEIPASHASLRIRQAHHADAAAIERLASLDSSRAPRGDVLLAEVGEELWAAFSLEDGHHVADPMRPASDAVLILAQRSRQLHRANRGRTHRRPSLRFARAA